MFIEEYMQITLQYMKSEKYHFSILTTYTIFQLDYFCTKMKYIRGSRITYFYLYLSTSYLLKEGIVFNSPGGDFIFFSITNV